MKKIIALVMTLLMVFGLTACGGGSKTKSDVEYIKDKGTMVVGVTVYAPMNYKDADDKWTGFDTEFAEAVAEELGVKAEFIVIDWDSKWETLKSKKIDCVWNGMTITDEAKKNANVTDAYVLNAQVVVMKDDKKADYKDVESLKSLKFAVEAGSAGEDIAKKKGFDITDRSFTAQSDALMAVKSAKADAAIIDITMAEAMTGEGTDYADLGIGLTLTEEEYGIACRKNSDLTDKLNEIMAKFKKDGTLDDLAEKYEVTIAE